MELMQTEVSESDSRWLRAGNRLTNRAGHQDLAAVARKGNPRGGVDSKAEVSRVGQGRAPGVKADPNSDRYALRPRPGANLPLDVERRVKSGPRLLEDGEHLVGLGIDFSATMLVDRRP